MSRQKRQKKWFYIYKIVNKLNEKWYIGKRIYWGVNPNNDSYMGSGKLIKIAIEKYGIENFSKEILEFCENEKELSSREAFYVNEDVVQNKKSYNITLGGHGGWLGDEIMLPVMRSESYRNKMRESIMKIRDQISASVKKTMSDPEWKKRFSEVQKEVQNRPEERERNRKAQLISQNRPETKEKISNGVKKAFENKEIKDKHKNSCNTDSFIEKQKSYHKETVWLHNFDLNKRIYIKKHEIEKYLNEGWKIGMGPKRWK